MENKTLRNMNIQIYGKICMAGYSLSRYNPLTMHHIIPLSDGGKTIFENSSNISNLAHSGVHIVSDDNYKKKKIIIDYLLYFKNHPDKKISIEFADWLVEELEKLEYREVLTKDKLLIYKRRNR